MEDWVHRALQRWPNVPALFGWLSLDRRGRWRIRGEPIGRPQIVATINRNYAADAYGRWYFQNGPQRGYVALEYAPLVLWRGDAGDGLQTHTGLPVYAPTAAFIDEDGNLLLATEHGPAVLADTELEWAAVRLEAGGAVEDALAAALAQPDGTVTDLVLRLESGPLRLERLDSGRVPVRFGFVREPQPRPGERSSTG